MKTDKIFTFWEPREKIPAYLKLCVESWKKYLPNYEIIILDYSNIKHFIDDDISLYKNFSLPIQSDAIRCSILNKYSGIWMDIDTIITGYEIEKKLNLNEAEFTIIYPHICFIKATKNSKILPQWKKRVLKRAVFYNNIFKYGFLSKIYLKIFKKKLYKKLTNWSYLGNDILNKILKQNTYLSLSRDELCAMPELKNINKNISPPKIYRDFYFNNDFSDSVLKNSKGIILLHNSWTPKHIKKMTEEEFLNQKSTLSNIFLKIL